MTLPSTSADVDVAATKTTGTSFAGDFYLAHFFRLPERGFCFNTVTWETPSGRQGHFYG